MAGNTHIYAWACSATVKGGDFAAKFDSVQKDHRRDFDAFALFGVEYDFCPKVTGQTHHSKSPGMRTVRFRFLVLG